MAQRGELGEKTAEGREVVLLVGRGQRWGEYGKAPPPPKHLERKGRYARD